MIAISKTDFERYVPVATQPEDSTEVFAMMQHGLLAAWMQVKNDILGADIAFGLENGDIDATSDIMRETKALICMQAFANAIRRNDLILTPTGFGIVNTDKVAPASRERVNALVEELTQHIYDTYDALIDDLVGVEDWYESSVAEQCIPTVFYHIGDYKKYASAEHATYFVRTDPKVRAANYFLIQHVGKDFHEELLTAIRTNDVTVDQAKVIDMMRRFIGGKLTDNRYAVRAAYDELINTLDTNLDTYPTYANSEAYQLNHFEHYANAADDPCYFFG